jgi:hypothetical protein
MAWQFDRSSQGDGVVQAFRRAGSGEEAKTLKLYGLDGNATYAVKNLDTDETVEISGKKLMGEGLSISIKDQPGSALITYKKK